MQSKNGKHKPLTQGQRAALLQVSREHLNRVLNGRRQSRRLIERHHKLIGASQ